MTAASVLKVLRFGSRLSGSPWRALTVTSCGPPGSAVDVTGCDAGAAVGAPAGAVVAAATAGAAVGAAPRGVATTTLLAPPPLVGAGDWAAGPHALTASAKPARIDGNDAFMACDSWPGLPKEEAVAYACRASRSMPDHARSVQVAHPVCDQLADPLCAHQVHKVSAWHAVQHGIGDAVGELAARRWRDHRIPRSDED